MWYQAGFTRKIGPNDKKGKNVEIEEIKEIDENGERGIENEEDSKNSDLEESVLEDEDISSTDFSLMSKDELESWARENIDLELDKRKKKSDLISEIKEALK